MAVNGYGFGHGYSYGFGHGHGYGDGYGDGFGHGHGDCEVDVATDTPLLAWHCVATSLHLSRDLSDTIAHVGLVLTVPDDVVIGLCEYGLHASIDLADARRYMDGVPCRVACSGRVRMSRDKLVCSRREILAIYPDGEPALEI